MNHRLSIVALLSLAATAPGYAASLVCVPNSDVGTWVKEITIDQAKRKVALKILSGATIDPATGALVGPVRVVTATLETPDSLWPDSYPFTLHPDPDGDITNIFTLAKHGKDWRLFNAGVIVRPHDHIVLRGVEPGKPYSCAQK